VFGIFPSPKAHIDMGVPNPIYRHIPSYFSHTPSYLLHRGFPECDVIRGGGSTRESWNYPLGPGLEIFPPDIFPNVTSGGPRGVNIAVYADLIQPFMQQLCYGYYSIWKQVFLNYKLEVFSGTQMNAASKLLSRHIVRV